MKLLRPGLLITLILFGHANGSLAESAENVISLKALTFTLPPGWKTLEREIFVDYPQTESLTIVKIVPVDAREEHYFARMAPVTLYIQRSKNAQSEKSWITKLSGENVIVQDEQSVRIQSVIGFQRESVTGGRHPVTRTEIAFTANGYLYGLVRNDVHRSAGSVFSRILTSLTMNEHSNHDPSPAPIAVQPGQPTVHIIYLVPQGLSAKSIYKKSLMRSIQNLHIWYQNEMPQDKTFLLSKPIVRVLKTPHPASWYATNNEHGSLTFWDNVLADGFELTGGGFDDPVARWIFYIDAYAGCNQLGGAGTSGVVVIGRQDLLGFAGKPNVDPCSGDANPAEPTCRWVGGMGHELGHAFNLPHPPGCEDQDPRTPCHPKAIMYTGLYDYPDSILLKADKNKLKTSPFFNPVEVNPLFDCSNLRTAPNPTLVSLRISNTDDNAGASIHGVEILSTSFQGDTGFVNITQNLTARRNPLRFLVNNLAGGWAYRFQIVKNGSVIFDEKCGIAGSQGCSNNDQTTGTVYDKTVNVTVP